jgi:predicted anti-sigma-YlaC factor YlaD
MNHRHLLPDEIDQLLDGEVGFGVAPLQAHLRECDECRAAYEEERQVVEALEHLPRLAPSPEFASRVMSQVQVYEPWHVAAQDTVLRWIRPLAPRSQPVRLALGGAAVSVAALLSVAAIWLAAHADGTLFFMSLVRTTVVRGLGSASAAIAQALLGRSAAQALGEGTTALILASIGLYIVVFLAAALALRAAAVSRRRRA